ncbi:MAG: GNAT family N-acetyltransferase, partial [Candidatus Aenigmarchaeota archaeon]|nr:GNAT family N-acetyltransferase [Candidatus Aenigmarchaeota archaeon]
MITIYEPKAHEIDISELTDFLQSLGEEHRLVFIDINRIVKSECVAVYRDDVVLGVAGVAKNKIGIRQFYVVVKLGYQKKGIGKRLLAEIIDW